ncbi:PTS-dependent dihydroxyacetone kinase phosphotransferase subunit DhaM, partial [Streptomyces sp. NPDC059466]|uniref:PTS-dependent dihydroxyacetone kinase phosphotransferase subunit DhaM n=1 Tax=Streptomyces sp. NPDC059466 TaxID=3346843 RepID=UPI0036C57854
MSDSGNTAEPLVGIVLVSHSAAVATSVAELATGLAGGGTIAPVAPAGGTADGGLGTSAELISAAAASVDRGAGVAVLMDLGSAVLTVKALLAEGDEHPGNNRLVVARRGWGGGGARGRARGGGGDGGR